MTARKKGELWVAIGGFLICMGIPCAFIAQQLRQEALDRALIGAVKNLDAPAVNRLLSQGANANARETKEPPLTLARLLASVRVRLWHKSSVDAGNSALGLLLNLCDRPDRTSYSGSDAIAVALLQHGADITIRGRPRLSPLHMAVERGLHQTIRLLVSKGADVNERDEYGYTPLSFADADATMLLLQNGAAINAKDNSGWCPLEIAALLGHVRVVEILLEHGANVNAIDRSGHSTLFNTTVLHAIKVQDKADIIRLLNLHGAHLNKKDRKDLDVFNSPL